MAERGLDVSYETVRRWCLKFGPAIARNLRSDRPDPSDHWHLDEMVIFIKGGHFRLWRAVDNEGEVLDFLVQSRRCKAAVTKLMRKLLGRYPAPACLVTDKLRSYAAAFRDLGLSAEHIMGKRLNNRAENSHQPVRPRERKMQRFKSPGSAQRFLNLHAVIFNHLYFQRHLLDRPTFKAYRSSAYAAWQDAATAA